MAAAAPPMTIGITISEPTLPSLNPFPPGRWSALAIASSQEEKGRALGGRSTAMCQIGPANTPLGLLDFFAVNQ